MTTSDRLLIGSNKGLLTYEKNVHGWHLVQESHRAIPVSLLLLTHVLARCGHVWIMVIGGCKLHRSKDAGETWQEVATPAYPEGAEREPGVPAKVSYIWYITAGGSDQPQRLYVGVEPGGLFVSDDGGDNFQLCLSLWNHPSREKNWFGGGRDYPGLCSIAVDPRNSQHIVVGISVGGVFESHDGGQTWEGRNKGLKACYLPNPAAEYGHDPHFLLMSPSNPDVWWQQNHCGIFRTADAGQRWDDISQRETPAFFGFTIALDAQNDQTAWVAPAFSDEYRVAVGGALCISRTEDGGKSWTALRHGLPQTDCYDLVYRHGMDISDDRLAFGTTTGNLYVSDDRGDHWECISHHLPPIYSVRFA